MNNLKQIALAMYGYEAEHKVLPPAAICDAGGKPLLSWRVRLLPYVGEDALYKQFHLDEPWDSPHNRELIEKMPAVYRSPDGNDVKKGLTRYLVPVGKGTIFFSAGQGRKLSELKDPAETILVVEADHAVTWTKPEELSFDPQKPAAGLKAERFPAAFADGHVEILGKPDEQKLRRLIAPL